MRSIGNFFRAIDNTLNNYVDYFDYRIRTGKFIGDIRYQMHRLMLFIQHSLYKGFLAFKKSHFVHILAIVFYPLLKLLMKVHFFENSVAMFVDMIKMLIKCYSEIFIVFALTFPTSILLVNLFQNFIVIFFVALLPIFLWNVLCMSSLYYCIAEREAGKTISLWQSTSIVLARFRSYGFPAIAHVAIVGESIISFLVLVLILQYAFTFAHILWSGSFFYWFIITFTGLLLGIGIFILAIVMHEAYFDVLLEDMTLTQALINSKQHIQTSFAPYLFFYLLFYLYCSIAIVRFTLSYLYLGLIVSSFLTIIFGVFLGFLLRRQFRSKTFHATLQKATATPKIFTIVILFGFINYVLVAIVITKDYQQILSVVQTQQDNYLARQEIKRFTNTSYRYTLEYPKHWNVYHWQDSSVTFYNNYTGTLSGGTWLTITVSPFDEHVFKHLSEATAGIVPSETNSSDITTKVSNFSIQSYEGVNFTFVKSGKPYPQYQTHYLIHKDMYAYDIVFVSLTNDVDGYNSELFNKIIGSFQFIK